ncbi:hypothetical protein GF351_01860 [Candidatus Woesearchaeota archaeon]|nr:hypothetical protein [Candidatus Woesearchaeota archaeon]
MLKRKLTGLRSQQQKVISKRESAIKDLKSNLKRTVKVESLVKDVKELEKNIRETARQAGKMAKGRPSKVKL